MATTNGGATWTEQTVPAGTYLLNGVTCISSNTCTAVGTSTIGFGGGIILATTNSGNTWTNQPVLTTSGDALKGVTCVSADCKAVGEGGPRFVALILANQ